MKKTSLGYIPSSKGERSIANMELLPKFYKAVWPFCNSDGFFRNQFMTERTRQYETNVKVGTLQQKLDSLSLSLSETGFKKWRQSNCMWKVFNHFIYSKSQ